MRVFEIRRTRGCNSQPLRWKEKGWRKPSFFRFAPIFYTSKGADFESVLYALDMRELDNHIAEYR